MAYEIRIAELKEVRLMVDWAASEGWNPGLDDAESFYKSDPGGFLIGWLDGKPVSCISAVRYGQHFGFIGFYIVLKEHRGQGLGLKIWNEALQQLEGRIIGLDGVPDQQENYKKSDFEWIQNNIRFQGRAPSPSDSHEGVLELTEPDDELIAYDRQFFADRRDDFLKAWIDAPHATCLTLKQENELTGYGVVRTCGEGAKIGPLFSETPEGAEILFKALAQRHAKGAIFLDVPEINDAAMAMVKKFDMAPVFQTTRMYRGGVPNLPMDKTYGITSFELG